MFAILESPILTKLQNGYFYNMENEFRLDRTSFRAMSMEEADKEMTDYTGYTWQERFKIANYLNSVAYNYPLNNPLKMDKTICRPRNLVHG